MPLKPYKRGSVYWAQGRVEYNGRPITKYIRKSTGSPTESGAWDFIKAFEEAARRRYLLGDEASEVVTFEMAVLKYKPKPADAKFLARILREKPWVGKKDIRTITGRFIKNLGLELMPDAATDTVWRQVVTPMRAVINNMHDLGKGPHLKVKAFTERERITRDIERGKQSRRPRGYSTAEWMDKFCAVADPYNAALALFMRETAARIDQAVSLRPKDLDLANRRVRLKAQKGHPEQWVTISEEMMVTLANLHPKQPKNRNTGERLEPRVFGYATKTGYVKRWQRICKEAGIESLTAHEVGRHGFATELLVKQGRDPVTVAKAGRWSSPQLVLSTYSHADDSEDEIRRSFYTNQGQPDTVKTSNCK